MPTFLVKKLTFLFFPGSTLVWGSYNFPPQKNRHFIDTKKKNRGNLALQSNFTVGYP
jgi:hypothetical protein